MLEGSFQLGACVWRGCGLVGAHETIWWFGSHFFSFWGLPFYLDWILWSPGFILFVFIFGPYPAVLRLYSWLWAQGLILVGLEDYKGCQRANLGEPCARQALYPLYYLLASKVFHFISLLFIPDHIAWKLSGSFHIGIWELCGGDLVGDRTVKRWKITYFYLLLEVCVLSWTHIPLARLLLAYLFPLWRSPCSFSPLTSF